VWDVETCKDKTPCGLAGHTYNVLALSWVDKNRLASSASDHLVGIWNIKTAKQEYRHGPLGDYYYALCAFGDRGLAVGGQQGGVEVLDAETARWKVVLEPAGVDWVPLMTVGSGSLSLEGTRGFVFALNWVRSGVLASGGHGGWVRIWDTRENRLLASVVVEGDRICLGVDGSAGVLGVAAPITSRRLGIARFKVEGLCGGHSRAESAVECEGY